MKLKGEKCFLRALEPRDTDWLFKWENNPENWLVSGTTTPFSRNDLENYIRGIRDVYSDKQLRLLICTEQQPVGAIDLFDFDPTNLRAGVGILIGETRFRGKGIALEALQILKDYCKDILHLHQLYANIPAYNAASIKLFKNVGFELSGTRKEWLKKDAIYHDEEMFQLILNKE